MVFCCSKYRNSHLAYKLWVAILIVNVLIFHQQITFVCTLRCDAIWCDTITAMFFSKFSVCHKFLWIIIHLENTHTHLEMFIFWNGATKSCEHCNRLMCKPNGVISFNVQFIYLLYICWIHSMVILYCFVFCCSWNSLFYFIECTKKNHKYCH